MVCNFPLTLSWIVQFKIQGLITKLYIWNPSINYSTISSFFLKKKKNKFFFYPTNRYLFVQFLQIVLSVLVAVVAAKPGLLHAPLVAAPAVTSIVQPPPLLVKSTAHVGSVVSHVPTSISSQSSSVVHR